MKLKDLGGSKGIKKGMKFTDTYNRNVTYHEVTSDIYNKQLSLVECIDITTYYSNGFVNHTQWYDYEMDQGIYSEFELYTEEYESYNKMYVPETSHCYHNKKIKVILVNTSGYWYCPDCKKDLGTLTEDEFRQAVQEQYGGKKCKPDPRSRK